MLSESVSRGTLRPIDLLKCFITELENIHPNAKNHYQSLIKEAKLELKLCEKDIQENASELIDDLMDAINQYVPEGYYFGAHPGDGSDFGYWAIDDKYNI